MFRSRRDPKNRVKKGPFLGRKRPFLDPKYRIACFDSVCTPGRVSAVETGFGEVPVHFWVRMRFFVFWDFFGFSEIFGFLVIFFPLVSLGPLGGLVPPLGGPPSGSVRPLGDVHMHVHAHSSHSCTCTFARAGCQCARPREGLCTHGFVHVHGRASVHVIFFSLRENFFFCKVQKSANGQTIFQIFF